MEREVFKKICESHMSFIYDYRPFNDIIDLSFVSCKMEFVLETILRSEYNDNGIDNVMWYIYERSLPNSKLKAWMNDEEIMYDMDSLYDFVELANKLDSPCGINMDNYEKACEDMSEYIKMENEFIKIGIDFSNFGNLYKLIFGVLEKMVCK